MPHKTKFALVGSAGFHIGDRKTQQDRVALLRHPRSADCVLGVVADGVGGYSGGRLAAEEVVRTCTEWFNCCDPEHPHVRASFMEVAFQAHDAIRNIGLKTGLKPHSTIAVFVILPDRQCLWIHSGDSRLHHFRGPHLLTVSRDHSHVQRMLDQKLIAHSEAKTHPKANVLFGALGSETGPPIGTHRIRSLQVGDTVLACSDGVWQQMDALEIGQCVTQMPCNEAAKWIISTALERAKGGSDNLSVVIVSAVNKGPRVADSVGTLEIGLV